MQDLRSKLYYKKAIKLSRNYSLPVVAELYLLDFLLIKQVLMFMLLLFEKETLLHILLKGKQV